MPAGAGRAEARGTLPGVHRAQSPSRKRETAQSLLIGTHGTEIHGQSRHRVPRGYSPSCSMWLVMAISKEQTAWPGGFLTLNWGVSSKAEA